MTGGGVYVCKLASSKKMKWLGGNYWVLKLYMNWFGGKETVHTVKWQIAQRYTKLSQRERWYKQQSNSGSNFITGTNFVEFPQTEIWMDSAKVSVKVRKGHERVHFGDDAHCWPCRLVLVWAVWLREISHTCTFVLVTEWCLLHCTMQLSLYPGTRVWRWMHHLYQCSHQYTISSTCN